MIEESLRRESPQQWNWRQVLQDVEIGGVNDPGRFVGSRRVGVGQPGRPRRSTRPSSSGSDRDNTAKQVAFGLGTHFCLGAPLARMEGRIAFQSLLRRLRDIRLADVPEPVVRRHAATSRSLSKLMIALTPG